MMKCQNSKKLFYGEIEAKFLYKFKRKDSKLISELNYF